MFSKKHSFISVFLVSLVAGCQQPMADSDTLFQQISSEQSGLTFVNQVADQANQNIFSYRNFYNGGGVGLGDFDQDGLLDIYLTGNQVDNRLYHNQGDLHFTDITAAAGVAGRNEWATGVAVVDVNGDDWPDIYVCYSGPDDGLPKPNELYINQGDLTFVEAAADYGLDDPGFATHALFFDYDRDNDLDCFILNNSLQTPDRIRFSENVGRETDRFSGDQLYENKGGKFELVTEESGIMASKIGFGLGASVADFNQDGFPDIYVSNDFWERDYCYLNQGDGTFSEMLTTQFDYTSMSSMGSDVGDIDNDGDEDIFTTDMLPPDQHRIQTMTEFENEIVRDPEYLRRYHRQYLQNCLQLNGGPSNGFVETARMAGVAASDWSWGALIFDFDLDGWKDIFVANGIYRDITDLDFRDFIANSSEISTARQTGAQIDLVKLIEKMPSDPRPNCAFRNTGHGFFDDEAKTLGLGTPSFSNGAAYGDLDNDGDYDLVINNVNMAASLYQSSASEQANSLQIVLVGPAGNRQAIGARVEIYHDTTMQSATLMTNRGFQSSVDPRLLFGLGDQDMIDSLVLTWPDGKVLKLGSISADLVLELQYNQDASEGLHEEGAGTTLFQELDPKELFQTSPTRHVEDDFDDFDVEGLLPHRLSNLGPRLATADVDKNGFQDLLILGATAQEDRLYLQMADGTFRLSDQPALTADRAVESSCALFFDADNDNDQDLIIGSGGNNLELGSKSYYARYYINDGNGNFSKAIFEAPAIVGNISCIKSADIDQDGDLDLFAGGLCVPGNYGLVPRSFLFRNDGGSWTDITSQGIGELGMVTDAEWIRDLETGYSDLLVVGEWMPITLLINEGGTLAKKEELPQTSGWWQSITPIELNGDQSMEYVVGNWGLNSRLQATPEAPLSMYVSDFDKNGKSEFIISAQTDVDGRPYPIASRMALTKQLPEVRRRAPSFHDYAAMQYEDLFSKEQRAAAKEYKAVEMRTGVISKVEGAYFFKPLPIEAQRAPVFAAAPVYRSDDDRADVLLFGNQSGLPPFLGSQSANRGDLFIQRGGSFQFVEPEVTGLALTGDVRDAVWISSPSGQDKLILTRNNDDILVVEKSTNE